MKNHNTLIDRAGFGNHPRITCLDCSKTIVKQPYMTTSQWINKASEFMENHPSIELEKYLLKIKAL